MNEFTSLVQPKQNHAKIKQTVWHVADTADAIPSQKAEFIRLGEQKL